MPAITEGGAAARPVTVEQFVCFQVFSLAHSDRWIVLEIGPDGKAVEACGPVFESQFTARAFAALLCMCGKPRTAEAEMDLAGLLHTFVSAWDAQHAGDIVFPTPDGHYPGAELMALFFMRHIRGLAA